MARRKKKGLTTKDYLLFGGIALFAYLLTRKGQSISPNTQTPVPNNSGSTTSSGGSTTSSGGSSTSSGGSTTSSFNLQFWLSVWEQAKQTCNFNYFALEYDCPERDAALDSIYDNLSDSELQQLSNAVYQQDGLKMYQYIGNIMMGVSGKGQLLYNYCQANGL